MKRSGRLLVAVLLVSASMSGGVALAHDADSSSAGRQPHVIGPYQVQDEVTYDLDNGTTTASYTVTVAPGAPTLRQMSLRLAACADHQIEEISAGGSIESKGGNGTATSAQVVKWKSAQKAGQSRTYFYRVAGLFEPENGEVVLKSGDTFTGTVQRVSCDPRKATALVDGGCALAISAANDSLVVRGPLGEPGLRIALELHCDPSDASTTEFERHITVGGSVVAALRSIDSWTEGGERLSVKEFHLPVHAVGDVCLNDPDNDANNLCVPPSG